VFVGSKIAEIFVSQLQWFGDVAMLGFLGKPATALCAVPLLIPSSALGEASYRQCLGGLKVLRKEVAEWQGRQVPDKCPAA